MSYSMRSVYHWLHGINVSHRNHHPCTLASMDLVCWKLLWKTEVPPKIKKLHAGDQKESLASTTNLLKRKCSRIPICPICNNYPETVEHNLPMGRIDLVWQSLQYESGQELYITTLDAWLCSVTRVLGFTPNDIKRTRTLICFFYYHIWKERCNVFIEPQPSLMGTIHRASTATFRFHGVSLMPYSEAQAQDWSPLPSLRTI